MWFCLKEIFEARVFQQFIICLLLQRAFQALCTLSVMTNCGFLYLSPAMKSVAPEASPSEWVLIFVALEHVLLATRQVSIYQVFYDSL